MKKIYCYFFTVILLSCNNSDRESSVTVSDKEYPDDTSSGYYPKRFTQPGNDKAYGFDSAMFANGKDESVIRRQVMYMGIDSTYYAINEIENIKNEIADESAVALSVLERNIKSKAILKLNIIQNSLARQVDSALLVNLKQHTKELAGINNTIMANVGHLKDISIQVNKAAGIMNRLTGVLAFCISKGFIKPPTPIKSNATQIKAAVQ